MNNILHTGLFSLLAESWQVTPAEMQDTYKDFTTQIRDICQSEKDCLNLFRQLNVARIEFMALQTFTEYGQGRKMCLKKYIYRKQFGISNRKSNC